MEIYYQNKVVGDIQIINGTVAKGNTVIFTSDAFSNLNDKNTYQIHYSNEVLDLEITKINQGISKDKLNKTFFEANIF